MRILVVCDSPPFPLTNGQNLRIYHYVRELRSRHSFDLLCLDSNAPDPALRELFGDIRVLPPFPPAKTDGLLHQLNLGGDQLVLAHPTLETTLKDLAARGNHDLFWFSGGGTMNPHFREPGNIAVLADVVDSMTLLQLREFRRASSVVERLRQGKRLVATALFERKVFRHADRALFVSEVDAAMFKRLCADKPTSVVHNGVDETYFQPNAAPSTEPTIAFEGNMGFEPNIEAAEWLCHEVLPLILESKPDIRVKIIGKDPSPAVLRLASERVDITGTVPDIRPHLGSAAVFVCPMQSGAGIKNKILQAWAMGMPTVATSMAIGGLDAVEGTNIFVRDDPRQFARSVAQLLGQPDLARRMGAAARQTILDKYCWSRKAAELEKIFEISRATADGRRQATRAAPVAAPARH